MLISVDLAFRNNVADPSSTIPQLIDDVLDFVGTQEVLGKPAANDMKLGTLTTPV
jgi:geranylgeranyl pyrophosphate synthase